MKSRMSRWQRAVVGFIVLFGAGVYFLTMYMLFGGWWFEVMLATVVAVFLLGLLHYLVWGRQMTRSLVTPTRAGQPQRNPVERSSAVFTPHGRRWTRWRR